MRFHKDNMNPLEVCTSAFLTKTPCCPAMLNTVGNIDITPVNCWKNSSAYCLKSSGYPQQLSIAVIGGK